MLAADQTPAATRPIAAGDVVRTSAAARARMHRGDLDTWIGIVLRITERRGQMLAVCGQQPTACRCHLERGDDRPEVSDPACLDCNGDGEAYWRARPLGDIEGTDAPAPQGITRWLPR
jgi:hypothetical protein